MRLEFALLGLGLLLSGCAKTQSDNDTNPRSKDEAMAQASAKSSGPTTTVCDVAYDSDGDGVNDAALIGICIDSDGDGDAAVPADPSDVFADGQCVCADAVLEGTVQVEGAGTDCDDTNAAVNPSATETCNGVDDNCDGSVDESGGSTTFFADADSDTYGNASATSTACAQPSGYVTDSTDCDDTDGEIYPGAFEFCNDLDDDCDATVDEDALDWTAWYTDGDADTYGAGSATWACDQPEGSVGNNGDCDDGNAAAFPGNPEVCDGADNDCAGGIDDGLAFAPVYPDLDDDGYGDSTSAGSSVCDGAGLFESLDNTDCDDANANAYPGATETWDDGIDQDCDGSDSVTATDPDSDGDGYPASTDCDDANSAVNPGAMDVDNDDLDNNCDGIDTEWLCVTGTADVGSDIISFYTVNYTEDWWELPFTGSSGTTTVCSSEEIVVGDEQKENGEVAGSSTYWLVMLDTASVPNHIQSVSIAGVSFTIGGVDPGDDVWTTSAEGLNWMLHPWSYTGSAPWVGRDLILVIPTTPS